MSDRNFDPLEKKMNSVARSDRKTPRIVILTGAGISAESGISTFRDANGLWEQHRIEDVASPKGYAANPDMVHRFYDARRAQLNEVQPNAAHWALARLEAVLPGEVLIVTQNVDDLHERAFSRDVLHMHGRLRSALCASCGHQEAYDGDLAGRPACTKCGRQTLRPDIVWFGEQIREGDRIHDAVEHCEVFVVAGTSGNVYPAAGLVDIAKANGAATVLIDLDPRGREDEFDEVYPGAASVSVPAWVRNFLLTEGGLGTWVEHAVDEFVEDELHGRAEQWGSYSPRDADDLLRSLPAKLPEHHIAKFQLGPVIRDLCSDDSLLEAGNMALVTHMFEHEARVTRPKKELRRLKIQYAVDLIAWMAVDELRNLHRG